MTDCATGAGRRLTNFRIGTRLLNLNRFQFFQPRRLEYVTNPLKINLVGVGQPISTTCTFGYQYGVQVYGYYFVFTLPLQQMYFFNKAFLSAMVLLCLPSTGLQIDVSNKTFAQCIIATLMCFT